MVAAIHDFEIEKGTDFNEVWELFDDEAMSVVTDLTSYTARMKVKASIDSSATILDLTTENSKIVLGGVLGTITFAISNTETAAIAVEAGIYDFELIDASSKVERLLRGDITFSKEVTTT